MISLEQRFGAAVREARERNGWTQNDLAAKLTAFLGRNVHPLKVGRIEAASRPVPLAEVAALVQLLNVEIAGIEAAGQTPATGAVIEIIERGATTDDTSSGSVIVPNEVRINGQPLLASADDPVTVHEISTLGTDLVRVTLTLFARRVTYAAEGDL